MIFDYFANKCLNLLTGKSNEIYGTGQCYLGFSTTVPNKDGTNINEPNSTLYPSYKRIRLSVDGASLVSKFGPIANGSVSNNVEFTSAEALEGEDNDENNGWPEFVWFIIFDASIGGNALAGDVLRDPDGTPDAETGFLPEKPLKVRKNKVAVFKVGSLKL